MTTSNRRRKKQGDSSTQRKSLGIAYVIQRVSEDGSNKLVASKVYRKLIENKGGNPPCLRRHLVKPLS